jgi:hypothetical protein
MSSANEGPATGRPESGAVGARETGTTRPGGAGTGYGYEPVGSYRERPSGSAVGYGFTIVAGSLMILGGLLDFFAGLAILLRKSFFHAATNYEFHWATGNWGWVLVGIGILVAAAGLCVFFGMLWARIVGIVLAVLGALGNFLFLPYYPVWAIIMIAVDVFIIWALATTRIGAAS